MPFIVSTLLCALAVAADINTPRGIATGIVYIAMVFCSRLFKNPKAPFIFAIIGSLLTVIGYFNKTASNVPDYMVITNRGLCIGAVWLVAVLVYTSRKAEKKAKDNAARSSILAAIVASSDDAIISKNLEGIIQSWNHGAERTYGYKAEEAIGNHISLLIPKDRLQEENYITNHIKQGFPVEHYETVRLKKDGTPIHVSLTVSPIYDEHGNITGASKIAHDITKRALEEEKFRLIVKSAPYAILMTDREGRIMLVNEQTERQFGYSREELLTLKVEDLIPERFRAGHDASRKRFFDEPKPVDPQLRAMRKGFEFFGLRKDGSEFPVEIGLMPLQTNEGMMVFSSLVDITERRKIEEERSKINEMLEAKVAERTQELTAVNKELEEFTFVASHDLKAPLRVIHNASKWLAEDLDEHMNDESRDNIRLLQNRALRMEKLLDDLLSYSRIGRKTDGQYQEIVKGDAMMEDILTLLSPPEGFTVKVDPAFADIEIFRMPLQQIIYNLINNAIKHHDKKTGLIEVKINDNGDRYDFTVSDDGPGIPQKFHDDVLKMFTTLKPRDQVEGSGMGLAMVKKHIDVFGGTLTIDSAEGKGCAFHFTWPKIQTPLKEAA